MAVGIACGFFRSSLSCQGVGTELRAIRQGTLNGMKLEPDPNIPKALGLQLCASWNLCSDAGAGASIFDVASGTCLRTDISGLRADQKLVAIAKEWHGKGANYFIRAELPGANNEKTASELTIVMDIMYAGWVIIGKKDDDPNPIAEIFREKNGAYVSARLEPPGAG